MPTFTIAHLGLRRVPQWLKCRMLAERRPLCLSEVEQEEERCLEAMKHWHDPAERHGTVCRRSHSRLDNTPASG
jgi:hypothetical protein